MFDNMSDHSSIINSYRNKCFNEAKTDTPSPIKKIGIKQNL
jgi:hypothetical protein